VRRPDLEMASPLGRRPRTVNMCELGFALTEMGRTREQGTGIREQGARERDQRSENRDRGALIAGGSGPAVHALFVYNSNPGAVAPNHNAVVRGLAREDLFTVVHDLFFNDTTDYADYVLPATTFLEHTDIQGAYGHYFVQLSQKAIEPPGEARPNVWLFGQLGQRMGFTEPCFRDAPEDIIRQGLGIGKHPGTNGHATNPWMEHITLEDLREHGHIPLSFHDGGFLPYASGPVPTPSGKIEFYSEALAAQGLDPLPAFVPPVESRFGEGAKRFPLEFLSRKADNYMNSTFANLDGHRKMEARTRNTLEMHADDARARSIANGDAVRIFNDRGSLRLTALLNGSVPAGVVAARLDWAKLHQDAANVNALTSERLTDLGAGATFYSVLVEVEKA
jgi:anaerobic selenocysteine-containing dehydrogenase